MRQRVDHDQRIVAAMVVVLRRPHAAVGLAHADRAVVHHAGQVPALGLGQRDEIDERLDRRTDLAADVQRAVEPRLARVAAADHGEHVAGLRVGDHRRRLHAIAALAQALERAGDRLFGIQLRGRVQRGEDRQVAFAQRLLVEVGGDLLAHQVHEGGEAVVRQLAVLDHVQRRGLARVELRGGDQAGVEELLQHQVAPRQRALGRAARVVVTRSLHQADQQGDLLRPQLLQPAPEIELRRGAETVHRLRALLAEEHVVDVGLEDAPLAVMRLQQQRHQRFVDLAGQRLVAAQEQVAHQLLGQRGAALHGVAGAQVGQRRARDRTEVDADVVLEIAVLDRLQALDQQRRHVAQLDEAALLLAGAVQRGDARRIEVGLLDRPVVRCGAHRSHLPAAQRHHDALGQLAAVRAGVAARGDRVAAALLHPAAGNLPLAVMAVAGKGQFKLQRGAGHRLAGLQRQWPRIHARGHREHQVVETVLHALVEHQHVRQHETDQQTQADPERNAQPRPTAAGEGTGAVEEAQGRRNPAIRFLG